MSSEVMLRCVICECWKSVDEMCQLLPCLHLFCSTCLKKSSSKTCLMSHCFSNVSAQIFVINNCENDVCPRKLSLYESNPVGNCKHELCNPCFEEYCKIQPAVCPVTNCNELLCDSESSEICDSCKKSLSGIKSTITKCCNARYCYQCANKKLGLDLNPDENYANIVCPEGKCISKSSRASKNKTPTVQIAQCMGQDGCEGKALNGFPSNSECEHDICIDCLDKMLTECETIGAQPVCPNTLCHQSYTVDSVIALKALFPQRVKYFSRFALENQGYFLIKDDSISRSEISPNFTTNSRQMEVKCELQGPDENSQALVIFDRMGNVADFIREMRRALKILPLDKVYGYYIRREGEKPEERSADRKPDEELVVDAKSVNRSISELNLTPNSVVVVDTSGIVQMKALQNVR